MTKSILVAVDLSQDGPDEKPLRVAAELAEKDGAQLDVVSVVPDFGFGEVTSFFPPDYEKKAVVAAKEALTAFCERVLGEAANAGIRHEVVVGKAYREVLRVAEAAGSDLIVVGSHRKEPVIDVLLGTTASQIVLRAKCSVYVVR